MTIWDIVAFVGMGLISIILALVEMNRQRMVRDIDKLEADIEELRKKDEHFVVQISERIHRDEWTRFQERQDSVVREIFKALSEIRDLLHTKQDRS